MRPCELCKQYVFGPNGLPLRKPAHDPNGQLVKLGNRKPPCEECPKIPPGVDPKPENAHDLNEQNRKAYEHWKLCDAVHWQGVEEASDPQVRRNAAVIREVREKAKRELELNWLTTLMSVGVKKRG